jgi:hypothetical protein
MLGLGERDALPAFLGFWACASGSVKSADSFTSFSWRAALQLCSL